ncbi:hypothetical protein PAXINDRAFT_134666 [Paxillus involutus ATCC 200175]|uniref:Unplaced genomic scaffold PAXINscaffold_19, whole genome shotgun sequence n=1 Tax=Paxillus involutus ATCC 200175 TaxID=664439 RepID=A0A0C9SY15_PAXIN|nr:hypothetical protein PAXINDRAFT_134666 [Paxillus involutus ATCC 200175]
MSGSCPSNGVTHKSCTAAGFVTSRITHPVAIAAFLSDILPELRSVQHSWDIAFTMSEEATEAMESYQQRWEEVEALVPAFVAVRKQCLERYQRETKVEDGASV